MTAIGPLQALVQTVTGQLDALITGPICRDGPVCHIDSHLRVDLNELRSIVIVWG
jgi:hypothetical protein